jgi:hypothetical protein
MSERLDVDALLSDAIRHFWTTREAQTSRQGKRTGTLDTGNRRAVTGGKHADGFVRLVGQVVASAGLDRACIHTASKTARTLPGFFRPANVFTTPLASSLPTAILEHWDSTPNLRKNSASRTLPVLCMPTPPRSLQSDEPLNYCDLKPDIENVSDFR